MQPAAEMSHSSEETEGTFVEDVQCNDEEVEGDVSEKTASYIFFDFECMQETGIHEPNLRIAHKVCMQCLDQEDITTCQRCGDRERVFQGPNTQKQFCEWLFGKCPLSSPRAQHILVSF